MNILLPSKSSDATTVDSSLKAPMMMRMTSCYAGPSHDVISPSQYGLARIRIRIRMYSDVLYVPRSGVAMGYI